MFEKREKQFQLIGAIGLLLASIFSLGYHHFDEHFQILEFANFKLGNISAEQLPWEYGSKMRPTVQPFMVFLLHKAGALVGVTNPFYISFFLRLLSGIFSFLVIRLFYQTFKQHFKEKLYATWFLIFSFTLWFVVYNGVRFSSENWSTLFFVLPFTLYFKWESIRKLQFLFLGICFGLSFEFRFQAAFLTVGFLAWLLFIRKEKLMNLILICLGGILMLGLGALSDHWFYNEWTLSPWNYFYENIVAGKASNFGEMPWYWYFGRFFVQGIPPLSLAIILAVILFCIKQPKSAITWVVITFLLAHFATSHKELRFLFPIGLFIPYMLIKALALSTQLQEKIMKHRITLFFLKLVVVANFLFFAVVCFRPADPQISLYRAIYNNYDKETILYHFEQNPYHRILGIQYYKRENLKLEKINSLEDIPTNIEEKQLVVFGGKTRASEEFHNQHSLVYSSFPDWVKSINFNDWQKRSKIWNVYELNQQP